ncbi:MAG: VacB/RNase II family 3'-5' exoribonuclease [Phycisphaerales bacterium]|nr:VacB/RNase II family 3'-5' exoribonuclease [Phycisphaerales bacterium]
MPLRFRGRILDHLSHETYKPSESAEIARQLRITIEERPIFEAAVKELIAESLLDISKDDRIRLPQLPDEVEGTIRITQRGFGFLRTGRQFRGGDLYVPQGETRDAVNGDRVRCKVVRRGQRTGRATTVSGAKDYGRIGVVVEVLERKQVKFAGKLTKQGREWIVIADGRAIREPIIVRDPHAKNANEGDKVIVEVVTWPAAGYLAEGVITEVLGEAGRPDVETRACIAAFDLPGPFAEEVIDAARDAASKFDVCSTTHDWGDRVDLTNEFIFTIDPPDAKDYDDAISISHNSAAATWTLGVHIADVAFFVEPGSPLDVEAQARATSVYLPRVVIPMLPEQLSNGVCSLQERVERFTLSVFIDFDDRGRPSSHRLRRSVIKSVKRLTYLEAQALIDGKVDEARAHAKTEPIYVEQLTESLLLADQLAKLLRKRRQKDGLIHLDLPEVELVFDDAGNVIDAVKEDDAFTHTLIEMFMVEANEALARTFADLHVPLLRRIHPEPGFADIEELRIYARLAQWRLPDEPAREDLQSLLEAAKSSPAARAIHFAVLRTMSKATYSPALVGHYALASEHYAHFTSPIRRYPDLLVHRVVHAYLDLTENGQASMGGRKRAQMVEDLRSDPRVPDESALIDLGAHCSDHEVTAEEAERDLRTFLVLKLLQEKHLGEECIGLVTGTMQNTGVFVSVEPWLVDGVVKTRDMPGGDRRADRWSADGRSGRLVANRSGASIGLGDRIKVKIARIDLASRTLDLDITAFARVSLQDDGSLQEKEVWTPKSTQPEAGKPRHRWMPSTTETDAASPGSAPTPAAPDPLGGRENIPRGRMKDGKRAGFKKGRRGKKSF